MTTPSTKGTMTMNRLFLIALTSLLGFSAPAFAQTEEVVYYHTDAIGSVRMTTDATGAVIDRYDFLPFGELWEWEPPSTPEAMQFAGKGRDVETGLDYFGARYHRARSGRFTSVDPMLDIKLALGDPQRWNRYAYASNNPLRYIDPDGRAVLAASSFGKELAQLRREYDRASGLAKAWLWLRLGIEESSILPTPFAIAGGSAKASIVLGETMRRVTAVAGHLRADTFTGTAATTQQLMAANMKWLHQQIASGAKVFDIGLDVARKAGSKFYPAEVKLLQDANYKREFVKMIEVDGKVYRLFQWIPK